jgi:uncharacterized membrane protein
MQQKQTAVLSNIIILQATYFPKKSGVNMEAGYRRFISVDASALYFRTNLEDVLFL